MRIINRQENLSAKGKESLVAYKKAFMKLFKRRSEKTEGLARNKLLY